MLFNEKKIYAKTVFFAVELAQFLFHSMHALKEIYAFRIRVSSQLLLLRSSLVCLMFDNNFRMVNVSRGFSLISSSIAISKWLLVNFLWLE